MLIKSKEKLKNIVIKEIFQAVRKDDHF